MARTMKWLALVVAVLTLCAQARAQVRYFHPEKFERATTTDESGKVQWAEHQGLKCPTCQGTGKMKCTTCERYPDEATKCPDCGRKENREAVCHACAGTGTFPDPLEHALCPGCQGAGNIICAMCPGSGILKLGTGAKRWSNCPGCRGDGWFECPVCEGKRLVEVAKLKPSLRDAEVEDLKEALETTNAMLAALEAFAPVAKNSRKEVKELGKIIKDGEKLFPPLKRSPKLVKDLMKSAYAGSNYQGQPEREQQAMLRIKSSTDYYLKHQKRMMELALKRAEANAQLAGGK